jgi:hypothetical protein
MPIQTSNELFDARGMIMRRITAVLSLFLVLALTLHAGCGDTSGFFVPTPAPLSPNNVNLIFVVSEDLAFQAPGDVSPTTANLTSQGLQRSLLLATYLQQRVLGTKNVTGVYALEPMTHLQTANNYPDIVAAETVQQFAMLNQVTVSSSPQGWVPFTANSYPLNLSYARGVSLPVGVAQPSVLCPACQGLDFNDESGDNESLVGGIITANIPGFYVFSAPWETTSALLTRINTLEGYNFALPTAYVSPNYIYAISIAPSGNARLVTFNSNLAPLSTYPVLPSPVPTTTGCTAQPAFPTIIVTGGVNGAVIPAGTNTNETMYLMRHAEAHPTPNWENGNYIGAGQWRALDLPYALSGKISPNQVWSIDPAQALPGSEVVSGNSYWSYIRPSLTVEPYAIANNLPYFLVSGFDLIGSNAPLQTVQFFLNRNYGQNFSGQRVLLAWEHDHFPPTVNTLIQSYFPNGPVPPADVAPAWPDSDYDTIWTVTLDATGNLTVDNSLCEGVDSTKLPPTPPQF